MHSSTLRELLSQIAAAVGVSVVLGFFSAGPLCAWEGETHRLITRLALQNDPSLQQQVQVEPIEDFLAATKYKTVPAFVQALHLNPSTNFPFKLPNKKPDDPKQQPEYEKPGDLVALLDVLSTYINEPDWGMDREICLSYPGYCNSLNKDYKPAMGAFRRGLTSQAFRHMYWPTGYLIVRSAVPPIIEHRKNALGEAPQRCQLFFDIAVEAAQSGHPYWAARFLAWSLHYPQDGTQPFHAAQLPSPKLEARIPILKIPDYRKSVRRLSHYHLAFERFLSLLLTGQDKDRGAQAALEQSILSASVLSERTGEVITKTAAEHSNSDQLTARAAETSMSFFPHPPMFKDLDVYAASDKFKNKILQRSSDADTTELKQEFIKIGTSCFKEASASSKTLIKLFYAQTSETPLPSMLENKSFQKLFEHQGEWF